MSQTTALLVRYFDVHCTTRMRRFTKEVIKRRRIFLPLFESEDLKIIPFKEKSRLFDELNAYTQ